MSDKKSKCATGKPKPNKTPSTARVAVSRPKTKSRTKSGQRKPTSSKPAHTMTAGKSVEFNLRRNRTKVIENCLNKGK